jgi:heptosyltransferase-2
MSSDNTFSRPEPVNPAASGAPRGRILVIRGGAIGDFILTLPVFTALRRAFPETHIETLAYPKPAQLALDARLVHAVRPLESRGLAGFFARKGPLDPDWSAYFASFNVILCFLFDPDLHFQSNIQRVSRAQFIAGPHRPDDTSEDHASVQLLRPLERLAIFNAIPDPDLRGLLPANPASIPSGNARIVVHPGSGSERKNWPESSWRPLLRRWDSGGRLGIDLVGGDAEGDRLERLAKGLGSVRVVLNEPLPQLARRIAAARLFVGHDSGISHLAAAVGAPGLVLWGPTIETVWRPRSNRFVCLRHDDGLDQLPVDVVDARIALRLAEG